METSYSDRILTSTEDALTEVMTPLRYPVLTPTVPSLSATDVEKPAVIAYPTWRPSVPIASLWSAEESIVQTLRSLAQEPGFLDAYVQLISSL